MSYLTRRTPWLPPGAVERLHELVKPGVVVFEWGAGGSTLFFLDRGAVLTTVEHKQKWADAVVQELPVSQLAFQLHVCPARTRAQHDPADYTHCASGKDKRDYSAYAAIIREQRTQFDLVLVDGRARPGCVFQAEPQVRPGGYLVLDDSQREKYQPVQAWLQSQGWHESHCFKDKRTPRTTTFWRAP